MFPRVSGPHFVWSSPSIPSLNVCAYIMLPFSLSPAWVPLLHITRDGEEEEEEVACFSLPDWHPIGGQTLS